MQGTMSVFLQNLYIFVVITFAFHNIQTTQAGKYNNFLITCLALWAKPVWRGGDREGVTTGGKR